MYKGLGFNYTFSDEQEKTLEKMYNAIDNVEIRDAENVVKRECDNILNKQVNSLVPAIKECETLIYTEFLSIIDFGILKKFNELVDDLGKLQTANYSDVAQFCKFVDESDELIKAIFRFSSNNGLEPRFWLNHYGFNELEKMTFNKSKDYIRLIDKTSGALMFKGDNRLDIYNAFMLKHELLKKLSNTMKWNDEFNQLYSFVVKLNWNKEIIEKEND